MPSVGGQHVAIRRACRAGTDAADRDTRQAAHCGQLKLHRADLIGLPGLVAGAAGRVALHCPGQADAERLFRELQRSPARRMPQRDDVHVTAPCTVRGGCLAGRLQKRQATLETGRENPRRESRANLSGGMPPDRLASPQPNIMKEPYSTSDW